MKIFIAVVALVAVVLADDPHGMKAIREKCQSDPLTHVDDSVFEALRKDHEKAVLPENFGKHVLCLAQGLDLVTAEGKANEQGIKKHVGHVVHEADKVEPIVKECAVDAATPEETAQNIWKCLHKNHIVGHHHHEGSHEAGHHHEGSHESSEESGEHHHHHHSQ